MLQAQAAGAGARGVLDRPRRQHVARDPQPAGGHQDLRPAAARTLRRPGVPRASSARWSSRGGRPAQRASSSRSTASRNLPQPDLRAARRRATRCTTRWSGQVPHVPRNGIELPDGHRRPTCRSRRETGGRSRMLGPHGRQRHGSACRTVEAPHLSPAPARSDTAGRGRQRRDQHSGQRGRHRRRDPGQGLLPVLHHQAPAAWGWGCRSRNAPLLDHNGQIDIRHATARARRSRLSCRHSRRDQGESDMKHLLIVDDERGSRESLRAIFEQDYTLSAGRERRRGASRLLAEERVDLVLLDVIMPDKDGLALLKEIQDALPRRAGHHGQRLHVRPARGRGHARRGLRLRHQAVRRGGNPPHGGTRAGEQRPAAPRGGAGDARWPASSPSTASSGESRLPSRRRSTTRARRPRPTRPS